MIKEYINIAHVFFIAIFISLLIFFLSLVFINSNPSQVNQKTSPYECGFNPFEDARVKFDVQFYLVCILFILFDLEISFLLPIIIMVFNLNVIMVVILNVFIILLTLGFIYE
jgi:NADH-quinone oxidoreductase subunit A